MAVPRPPRPWSLPPAPVRSAGPTPLAGRVSYGFPNETARGPFVYQPLQPGPAAPAATSMPTPWRGGEFMPGMVSQAAGGGMAALQNAYQAAQAAAPGVLPTARAAASDALAATPAVDPDTGLEPGRVVMTYRGGKPVYYGSPESVAIAKEGLARVAARFGVRSPQYRQAAMSVLGILRAASPTGAQPAIPLGPLPADPFGTGY